MFGQQISSLVWVQRVLNNTIKCMCGVSIIFTQSRIVEEITDVTDKKFNKKSYLFY